MQDTNEILQLIDDCLYRESRLTPWEFDFISSISEQIDSCHLTDSQIKKLEAIWERVT